jgi:outer membrane lipopolysaccharide assembly protein LptE/RlpB
MKTRITLHLTILIVSLTSCGYRSGFIQGSNLQGIKKIHVPVAENTTFQPALGPIVTDAVIQRIMRDGTLSITNQNNSDATLKIKITHIERNPQRSTLADERRTAEYQVRILADFTLTRDSDGTEILSAQKVSGQTDYFVGQDLPESERQALGLAANKLAENIVLQIVEGW